MIILAVGDLRIRVMVVLRCFALFFAFVFEGDLMAASRRKSRWEAHLYHCMLRT
jgi:hypothetical protein